MAMKVFFPHLVDTFIQRKLRNNISEPQISIAYDREIKFLQQVQ